MNTLFLKKSSSQMIIYKNVKLLVFDMAGTTINEKGIVYDTLYNTIKNFGLNITRNELSNWYGCNKYEVLNHFLYKDKKNIKMDQIQKCVQEQLYSNFDNNLKEKYFAFNSDIEVIDEKLPDILYNLKKKDIKISLNTGYSKDIQESIIKKLNMNELIDDYISSEEVKFGRPYPYMIYRLMERNNIQSVKSVIKFGDTQNDILEGINANCLSSIGLLTGAETKEQLKNAGANIILNNLKSIE